MNDILEPGILERLGAVQTESDVRVSFDTSAYGFAAFSVALVIAAIIILKKL